MQTFRIGFSEIINFIMSSGHIGQKYDKESSKMHNECFVLYITRDCMQ